MDCTIDNAFNLRDLVLQELVKIIVVCYINNQWRTQEFCSGRGGSTNSVEDRENGDVGPVAP